MKKGLKRTIFFIIAIVCVLLVVNIFRYLNKNLSYSVASKTTVENIIASEALVIRNEKTIPINGGVFEAKVAPGTRVGGKSLIGYLYKGTLDNATESKLRALNERIAQLSAESLFETKNHSTIPEEAALNETKNLIFAINSGDFQAIPSRSIGIKSALNQQKKDGEKTDFDEQLAQLREERSALENQISAVRENVFSPFGGIFSETVDGYEDVLPVGLLKTLTPSVLKDTVPIKNNTDYVKIIDNSEWYLALEASSAECQNLTVGSLVYLRSPELSNENVPAKIYAVNHEGDECCVVIACSRTLTGIYDYRHLNVQVITSSQSGYKIPSEALRMREGQQGVYVVRDNIARFVPIEILLQDDEFILVSTITVNGIKLYDEVIASGNVEEGMLVR